MNVNNVNLIINTFINHYEYSIFEFKKVNSGKNSWGLRKNEVTAPHYIVFGDLKDIVDLKDSINKYCFDINVQLHYITYMLFSDGSVDINHLEKLINYVRSDNSNNTVILINEQDTAVLYSDPQVSQVAEAVQVIMANSKKTKEKHWNGEIFTVTHFIIFINIIMYVITAYLSGSIIDSDTVVLIYLGAKHNALIAGGQYYRLITAMFLHGGIVHIALNMYALKSIGPLIENMYGKLKFTLIYFVSGITSSIFSYYFSSSISVGASGAIFGLMGAALILGIKIRYKVGREFLNSILQVIIINLIIGFSISNVDNFGHLGGLIGGLTITSLFYIKN